MNPRKLGCLLLILLGLSWSGQTVRAEEVRIFAHRGFTVKAPENSLGSIQAAIDLGLDGSEIDVRTTRDRVPVCLHDEDLDRTTTCSGKVNLMDVGELDSCRLKGPDGQPTDFKVPRLAEMLDLVKEHSGFDLVLDIKEADTVQTASLVLDKGMIGQVVFSISDPMNVETAKAVKSVSPEARLSVNLLTWWKIEGLPTFVAKALDAEALFASEWFFPRCGFSEARENGTEVQVFLWGTHDLVERARRAVRLGAQLVSSDRPDILLPLKKENPDQTEHQGMGRQPMNKPAL